MHIINNIIIPYDSKRRALLKLLYILLKHPVRLFSCLKPQRMKKILYLVNRSAFHNLPQIIIFQTEKGRPYDYVPTLLYRPKAFFKKFSLPIVDTPLVSIVIPSYNNFSYTYTCIKSILKHTNISYEVIVADDCSKDKTKNISNTIKNVVHLKPEKNLKFLHNCNNAAKHAKGKYLFLLNNDTQLQTGSLDSLVSTIEQDDTIGIVGSRLIYPIGILQDVGGIVWSDGSAMNIGRGEEPGNIEYNYVRDVDYVTGAALLIRKSIWEKLGGFDERFSPAYYEDTDLAFSTREMGYRTVVQPKSNVIHFEGISHGTNLKEGIKHYQELNAEKFYDKWKHILEEKHVNNKQDTSWIRYYNHAKKVILFVDIATPEFDRHAGCRNIFMYLKLFRELGYSLVFIGDDFKKKHPYTDILLQMGIPVLHEPWYGEHNVHGWLEQNGKHIDYVYLHKAGPAQKYIDIIKKISNAKIIFHVADLHHIRLKSQYDIEGNLTDLKDSYLMEGLERYLCDRSDVVLTVSEKEKPIIQKLSPNTPVIVAPIFYYDKVPQTRPFSERKDILFVGGFSHAPNPNGARWFVNNVMPMLPNVNLILAGSNPPESIKALNSNNIKVTGYISDEELEELYLSSRICIIPLQFGAGVKGKTVEAIHYQIPIVSTSHGIEGLPIDDMISPCNSPEAFAAEIQKFLNSDEECENAAIEYKKWIQRWFSRENVVEVVHEMLSV